MPSGPVATPSVNAHAPPKTRSSFPPAGRTLASPFGAGNPGSSAHAAPAARAPANVQATIAPRRRRPIAFVENLGALPLRNISMNFLPNFFGSPEPPAFAPGWYRTVSKRDDRTWSEGYSGRSVSTG